jgi:simple sugar transport system permease protein
MNAMTEIPPEIADTIIATIIYFTATSVLFKRFWDAVGRRSKAKAVHNQEEADGEEVSHE